MRIGVPKERFGGEDRVALSPQSAIELQKLGYDVAIQKGAGERARFSDRDYEQASVEIVGSAQKLYQTCDIIAKVRPPEKTEITLLAKGKTLISFFWPTQNEAQLKTLASKGVNVIAMDMVPRISRAQKMDALSSMANIAGYRAVVEASQHFGRFFTGQITAAGKVPPAKVLVIGAGVAGLAAIGVAQSMGAIVRAFDVRPEVAEQIESMGATFLFLDFEESGSGEGGYAAPSSSEFFEKQLALFRAQAPQVDIVITTALIPGLDAPRLWLKDMVEAMKPGSVVVDLAAERGGNCDLTVMDEIVQSNNGVKIIGYTDFPSRMATQSSCLYANNIRHMMSDLTPEKDGHINIDMEDDVIRGATVAHEGEVTFPPPKPKIAAMAKLQPKTQETPALTPHKKREKEMAAFKKQTKKQVVLLVTGGFLTLLLGAVSPPSFMQHFIVFALSVFVGFQVIWNVSHALHTPLMAITNAISSIIILGAILQVDSGSFLVAFLAAISIFMAGINIFGGFLVTRRMLAMFQKS